MYTLIIMKKNSTDSAPRTVHLSAAFILLMGLFFFGLPVAGYVIFNKVIAPKLYAADLIETTETKRSLIKKVTATQEELGILKIDNEKLREILTTERKQRAESEARATIAETAKTATGQQIASTEGELRTLQRKVAFYENLLKPKGEQERLQCFNMDVSYAKGRVRYGVSFLKNNPKDRQNIAVKAKLRVIPATSGAATGVGAEGVGGIVREYPVLSTRSFSLTKDYRLSGTLGTTVDENVMHILDIEVKDTDNNLVAKCWQSI